MSKPTREIKQGTCAYCGAVGDVTDDHVIPRCLWGNTAHGPLPIVDACTRCNNIRKSGHDAYLRDLLVTDRSTTQNSVVQEILPKFNRSIGRNQSFMARDLRDHGKVVATQRPSGLYIFSLVAEVAEVRTREIMSLVVRVLHQYYLHEPLPKDTSIWMSRLRTKEQIDTISNDIASFSGEYHKGECKCVDDGAFFSCAYVDLSMMQQDHTTLWQLNFYGNVVFAVATNLVIRNEIPPE